MNTQELTDARRESIRVDLIGIRDELDYWLTEWPTMGRPNKEQVKALKVNVDRALNTANTLAGH